MRQSGGMRNVVNSVTEPTRHLEPSQAAGRALVNRRIAGPVVMLNLLRFRALADYSASPELAPTNPISGAEAFDRYIAHTLPCLGASGGELIPQFVMERMMLLGIRTRAERAYAESATAALAR